MAEEAKNLEQTPGLAENLTILSEENIALANSLIAAGQSHLFASWPAAGTDDAQKQAFFEQAKHLNSNYPGGIQGYVDNAKVLLQKSKEGANPFEGKTPKVPAGETLQFGSEEYLQAEAAGLPALGGCCFVLVAGGLGERLGFNGIKVALPSETTTNTCFLKLYVETILAFQALANSQPGATPVELPLAIMTSGDTHDKTVELLANNNNFGAAEGQITLLKQEKVGSFVDSEARLALKPAAAEGGASYTLLTKPHGHGDVHYLLHSSGVAKKWADEGRKWVLFFQDTNGVAFKPLVAALGVSTMNNFHVNSLTVPRRAKDAVGAICCLEDAEGATMTINVEYNQLDPLLRATTSPEGDVNGPNGLSPFPGNINQLLLDAQKYATVLEASGGAMPEFVNPKYKDATKTTFKSPARLECMMQDYPRLLDASENVGFTLILDSAAGAGAAGEEAKEEAAPVFSCFSPVKNNVADAAKKQAGGNAPACAASGETSMYETNCRMLSAAGVAVGGPTAQTWSGITVQQWPAVVLSTSFAPTLAALKAKLPALPAEGESPVSVSATSTLVVEGENITINKLALDGALTIKAVPGASVVIKNLTVNNNGWRFVEAPTGDDVPQSTTIRGYVVEKLETRELVFDAPGEYEVDE